MAIKSLQKLDTLLLANRKVFDQYLWVYVKFQFVRQSPDIAVGFFEIEVKRAAGLGSKDDVFGNSHSIHQHEMLMDHADAKFYCIVRRADIDLLSVDQYLPAVGVVKPVN